MGPALPFSATSCAHFLLNHLGPATPSFPHSASTHARTPFLPLYVSPVSANPNGRATPLPSSHCSSTTAPSPSARHRSCKPCLHTLAMLALISLLCAALLFTVPDHHYHQGPTAPPRHRFSRPRRPRACFLGIDCCSSMESLANSSV
jgi:hypothetical protein